METPINPEQNPVPEKPAEPIEEHQESAKSIENAEHVDAPVEKVIEQPEVTESIAETSTEQPVEQEEVPEPVEAINEHQATAETLPEQPVDEQLVLIEDTTTPTAEEQDKLLDKYIKRRRFIAFGTYIVMGTAAYGSWRWLLTSPPEIASITGGAHQPLRRALNKTELFFRRIFSDNHLVKTYPKELAAKNVRANSFVGMEGKFDAQSWILQVTKKSGEILNVTLNDLLALPKTEIIYDFKCVEGWDQISHWGGVKFSDFVAHYQLEKESQLQYVGMETPDKKYYVGIDMPSAMHPQTMLAYEVNDKLLPTEHGAPLRLIIPVKYGIKNLKRIGSISFSDQRPHDYWAELGYDYYSGL